MSTRKTATLVLAAALSLGVTACGSRTVQLDKQDQANASMENGSHLFAQRCAGCHTLNAAGTRGSKPEKQRQSGERTNGPNFNVRSEQHDDVLFAIRNGGFSGAIMPANIVVGADANDVANFLSKYAGRGGSDTTNNNRPTQSAGGGGGVTGQ